MAMNAPTRTVWDQEQLELHRTSTMRPSAVDYSRTTLRTARHAARDVLVAMDHDHDRPDRVG